MNKKQRITLIVGFSLVLLTFIATVAAIKYYDLFENTDPLERALYVPSWLLYCFPMILQELSLVRSIYNLFNANRSVFAKICCIVSSIISVCALVFEALAIAGVITDQIVLQIFPKIKAVSFTPLGKLRLLIHWGALVVSIVLGSVGKWAGNRSKKRLEK